MDDWHDNPLRSRSDLRLAVNALAKPVLARFSAAGARAHLGEFGAAFGPDAAGLEGFARPLWGLAPYTAGGAVDVPWHRYRDGIVAGTDPRHAEYWGDVIDRDQRMVEMAAVAFGLCLLPGQLWEPLPPRVRDRLVNWLSRINTRATNDSNWLFFRVLVNLALARVGARHDSAAAEAALSRLDTFYLGDGWYSDGPTAQRDYYSGFAMHFYGLLYARLSNDHSRSGEFRERAIAFAHSQIAWFSADGAALPFGRSLSYRFAQAAFWSVAAFADTPVLPWGQLKGLLLRHLRWWRDRPILTGDGILSAGYGYPAPHQAEQYTSPASPYWAMKAFLPLALPEHHPFWTAEELALPVQPAIQEQPHAGMVIYRDPASRHVVALSGTQHALWVRHGAEKYAKFAYSTAFAFSVPSGRLGLEQAAADSMLAVSLDRTHFLVREKPADAKTFADRIWTRWQPVPGVDIETWLIARPPWHIRIHRVDSVHLLHTAEGGFAIDRHHLDPPKGRAKTLVGPAAAATEGSGLLDLDGSRTGTLVFADTNTNLLHPRTAIPTLLGTHAPGRFWLRCAVLADPDPVAWTAGWASPPNLAFSPADEGAP